MENILDSLKVLGKRTALSYFIPGIFIAWLLIKPICALLSQPLFHEAILIPDSEIALWAAFFVFAWIVGSLLKLIGSLLDYPVYDLFFKKIAKRKKNDLLAKAEEMIKQDLDGNIDWSKFDYFNYAVTFIKSEKIEEGINEIDEYIGNSKLFRSLAITLLGISGSFVALGLLKLAIGTLVLSLVALWVFCNERWNSTQRAYEYYIIARSKRKQA